MNTDYQKRTPLSDGEIVDMYFDRDENAISESDFKYGKYLFSVSYNIVQSRLDCEECVNDTYLGAWNSIPPARPQSLRAFLLTIIRRISVNRYHQNTKKKYVPTNMTVSLSDLEDFVAHDDGVESYFDAKRLGEVLSQFVRELPERRQYIFMSRYFAADSIDDIAKELNLSKIMVKKELAAIRALLREMLEKEGYFV